MPQIPNANRERITLDVYPDDPAILMEMSKASEL